MTDPDEQRVEHMLRLATTKDDLRDLVRMLDNRNCQLQHVIRALTTTRPDQEPTP